MFDNGTASSMLSETPHPFYPIGVEIAGYLANDKDTLTLLGIALAGLAVICSATWTIVSAASPGLRTRDKLTILWFISSRFLSLKHTVRKLTLATRRHHPLLLRGLLRY
jgi:hypothetical protein